MFIQTEDIIIITWHRAEFYSIPNAAASFYLRWPFIIILWGREGKSYYLHSTNKKTGSGLLKGLPRSHGL